MKIQFDPDRESHENMELIAKIIQAKAIDKNYEGCDLVVKTIKEAILKLEKKLGRLIPLEDLEEEAGQYYDIEEVSNAINAMKRNGDIFEPRKGFIKRV